MKKMMTLLAATAIASFLTMSSGQQAWAKSLAEEIRAQVEEAVEKAEKQAGETTEGNEARTGDSVVPVGKAVLEVAGDPGTEFSGACVVGDEERSIGGKTPQTYTYDLDGRRLECEIRGEGGGDLRIVFDAANAHSEQSIGSGGAVAELVYDDGVFVTSSSSGSSSQTSVQSSSSSSRVITSQS